MKTTLFSLVLAGAGLIALPGKAQMYLSVDAGWGIAAVKSTIGTNVDETESSSSRTGVYDSYGKGLLPSVTFGYFKSDNVAFEAGYGYHNMMGQVITRIDQNYSTLSFSSAESFESSASSHRFLLGLKLTAGEDDWKPYMKAFVFMSFGTKMDWYDHYSENDNGTSSTSEMHYEFTGGSATGGIFALGMSKSINDKLSFFFQGTFCFSSWAPQKASLLEYTVDGQDMMSSLTVSQKEYEFVDSYTISGASDPNQPTLEIRELMPYSSAGLNFGLTLNF